MVDKKEVTQTKEADAKMEIEDIDDKKNKVDGKESSNKNKVEEKKVENAKTKKTKQKEIPKKEVAIANGYSLKISPKQSVYVCRVIRGKSPENAIKRLQDVISEKRPVPMAGLEVGHKKGRGLAGGKFPKNACKAIIEIVKQVWANAVVAGIGNPVITIVKSDRASAPYRRSGQKAKRTHIHIEVREKGDKK